MLYGTKKLLKRLLERSRSSEGHHQRLIFPKAAPSAKEAMVPFEPTEYVTQPRILKCMIDEDRDFVLVDVREEWEFRIAHIEGARSIPLQELPQRVSELNPYDELIIYCHHGIRSIDATHILRQIGFKRVTSLVGGINLWMREVDKEFVRL